MRKYTGGVLQSMLSFTIVLFAHRSNYSFCRKRLLSLVFGAFLLDLLCCHTTLSANQRLTAGTYTAEFDYDVVGTLAAARYDEVDILYKLPDRIGNIYPDRFGKEATYVRYGFGQLLRAVLMLLTCRINGQEDACGFYGFLSCRFVG